MEADRSALVALFVEPDRRLVAVLVEVGDFQPASRGQASTGVQEKFQNRAVAVVEDGVAGRQTDELPGAGGRQGSRLLPWVRGLPRDELRMCRIRHDDRQPELGRGGGQVFIKTRQRRDAPVEGFGYWGSMERKTGLR
jgi:hypothetical protein